MLKKFFSLIGIISLSLFSFYYTQLSVNLVMEQDPIMKEIKAVKQDLETEGVDATLIDNNIIPGISGTRVDLQKSFKKMKRYGKFSKSLLTFISTKPSISIDDNYDKYIIKGNESKKNISLIFIGTEPKNIPDIIKILDQKQVSATFFLDMATINNNPELIKLIFLADHEIELLGPYIEGNIRSTNNFFKTYIGTNLSYCYTPKEDEDVLNLCKKMHLHTVIPTKKIDKYPYLNISDSLENGNLYAMDTTGEVIKELKSVITLIKQNNYKIVKLKELLKE